MFPLTDLCSTCSFFGFRSLAQKGGKGLGVKAAFMQIACQCARSLNFMPGRAHYLSSLKKKQKGKGSARKEKKGKKFKGLCCGGFLREISNSFSPNGRLVSVVSLHVARCLLKFKIARVPFSPPILSSPRPPPCIFLPPPPGL